MPAAYNDRAEMREIEPYIYCQSTHGAQSPRKGASRLPWLSGSAAWSFFSATQYLLGIRPEPAGLRIDPCIPAGWKKFKVSRRFRNKSLEISIDNKDGVQKGVREIVLNGKRQEGNLIPFGQLKTENSIEVRMG